MIYMQAVFVQAALSAEKKATCRVIALRVVAAERKVLNNVELLGLCGL